jgi:hypothetical protein
MGLENSNSPFGDAPPEDTPLDKLPIETLKSMAMFGQLPGNHPGLWDRTDEHGQKLAFYRLFWGPLPEGFDKWDMTDRNGLTILEASAKSGQMPEDFYEWTKLVNSKTGRCVAHFAIWHEDTQKRLRALNDERIWLARDRDEWTVAHQAALVGARYPAYLDNVKDGRGVTVGQVRQAVDYLRLPDGWHRQINWDQD